MTEATARRARFNLVDATVILFLFALIPVGYATYLLFRPARPQIESVTPSVITREERRISAGSRLVAKFKVKGTGFTPLLRARIGNQFALGFVFENPNFADILVGPMPPGAHDLVLVDGIQDVAIAPGAITIQAENPSFVRAAGWLVGLDRDLEATLIPGFKFPADNPAVEIVAVGPAQPARSRIRIGGAATEVIVPNLVDREAVLVLRCEASVDDNPCSLGERPAGDPAPVKVALAGPKRPFEFAVGELLPPADPVKARLSLRLDPDAPAVRSGDRDQLLDSRAAIVTGVDRRGAAAIVSFTLGVDRTRTGWSYRGRDVHPGARFVLRTMGYEAHGTVEALDVTGQ